MLGPVNTFEHEPVDELSGESHPDATARPRIIGLRLLDEVVKCAIEMWQRDVDSNARDRQAFGCHLGRFCRPLPRRRHGTCLPAPCDADIDLRTHVERRAVA